MLDQNGFPLQPHQLAVPSCGTVYLDIADQVDVDNHLREITSCCVRKFFGMINYGIMGRCVKMVV